MEDETYNGWSNYETWAVNLWLDNDQDIYNEIRDIVKQNKKDMDYELGSRIKDYVLELPEIASVQDKATLAADLIGSALSEVDWTEIAVHIKESF